MGLVEGCNPSPTISPPQFTCERRDGLSEFVGQVSMVAQSSACLDSLTCLSAFMMGYIRHPNTIAYPEKFFESAQAIAAHSHLRWPDLSREWIRRQQARIARVDWESRLPCVLGPRKPRLPLYTRKQQRLLDKAREMDGVPDLSALLKGKLQLLSKKSTTVDPQGPSNSGGDGASEGGGTSREGASKEGASREGAPTVVDQGVGVETSASGPKKKKKSKKTKGGATDKVPPEESASLDATSEGSKAKKKKDGKKRSRGGAASSVDRGEGLAEGQEGALVGAAPDGRPKKRTKRSVEAKPRPSTSDANAADATSVDFVGEASGTPENLSKERRKTSSREGGSGGEPERCAELTRQICGGTKEMPQLEDLYFKNEYIDAASSRARSDGSMNFLVEKYDSALKQTMIQLGSSEKLAQARLKAIERSDGSMNFLVEKYDSALKQTMIQLGSSEKLAQARLKAIERVRVEHKKANEKAAKEKEILRVKFEELEGKLKSARAAKKDLARENTCLEQAAEETKNVGIEDPVLVTDSSSEGREDEEEEDDRVEETSPPQPVEEETTNEVGDRDVQKPSTPTVDSLVPVSTRVEDPAAAATEDPAAAATEDPIGRPALGTP
ncbi:hypothetical protein F2Q70_00023002 [Brassica cretica]|uniref:Uncharacterized protein n=1 Tax=Brassica cretica TaxID=69181 RepID=A0A8S9GU97_BRACR|nr:hypothetical protein F2Q70_00023002 [Brassica cretica]